MNKLFGFIFLILLIFSCKPLQRMGKTAGTDILEDMVEKKMDTKRVEHYFCDNVDIRISGAETKNLRGRVLVSTGKFIFISVSFFGLELGRAQITEDSIKYINRLKREYYFGSKSGLEKLAGINFTYEEIENLILTGIPFKSSENKNKIMQRFYDGDSEYIYQYGSEVNKFVKVYYKKLPLEEYKIEISDKSNGLFLNGILGNYKNNPYYPGSINVSLLNKGINLEINIIPGKIENRDYSNISFKVNNNYNEVEL